jgi:hypothetical protein
MRGIGIFRFALHSLEYRPLRWYTFLSYSEIVSLLEASQVAFESLISTFKGSSEWYLLACFHLVFAPVGEC